MKIYACAQFPTYVRPFYTMENLTDAEVTNSYDWFIRGEEICSGAQRIHDRQMLHDKISRMCELYFSAALPVHAGGERRGLVRVGGQHRKGLNQARR